MAKQGTPLEDRKEPFRWSEARWALFFNNLDHLIAAYIDPDEGVSGITDTPSGRSILYQLIEEAEKDFPVTQGHEPAKIQSTIAFKAYALKKFGPHVDSKHHDNIHKTSIIDGYLRKPSTQKVLSMPFASKPSPAYSEGSVKINYSDVSPPTLEEITRSMKLRPVKSTDPWGSDANYLEVGRQVLMLVALCVGDFNPFPQQVATLDRAQRAVLPEGSYVNANSAWLKLKNRRVIERLMKAGYKTKLCALYQGLPEYAKFLKKS